MQHISSQPPTEQSGDVISPTILITLDVLGLSESIWLT